MKKLVYTLLLLALVSCSNDETISQDDLTGTWRLDAKTLTFFNSNFQFENNENFFAGYYSLEDNVFEAITAIKRGQNTVDYPEKFSGKVSLSGDQLIFTDFTSPWNTIFNSSYTKE